VIQCAQIIAGGGTDSGQSRNNAVSCNSNSDNMRMNASAENMAGRAVAERSSSEGNSILFDNLVLTDILFEQLQGYTDYDSINSLLNVSKQYENVKKAKYYWKLKRNYSLKYYSEKKFRSEVQSVLTDVNKQLSLNLDSAGGIDVSALSSVTSLMTDDCLGRNDILDLGRRNLGRQPIDVRTIGNVHSVNLYGCQDITDVTPLRYVRLLNLSGCRKIVDVSSLRNVYSLDLSYCINIVDVYTLGNVHCLNLRGCDKIMDVRDLRNVFSLNLSRCTKIRDVSTLGNVVVLHLRACVLVTDVSALHSCHVIFLDAFQQATLDISALVNVDIREQ
jgi:hypothetical protein